MIEAVGFHWESVTQSDSRRDLLGRSITQLLTTGGKRQQKEGALVALFGRSRRAAPQSTPGGVDAAFDRLDYLIRRAGESPMFAASWYYLLFGQAVPCVACLTEQRLLWVVEGRSEVIEMLLEEVVAVAQNDEGWLRLTYQPNDFPPGLRSRNPEGELDATFFMGEEEKHTLHDALVRESRYYSDYRTRLNAYKELEGISVQTWEQVRTLQFTSHPEDSSHSTVR